MNAMTMYEACVDKNGCLSKHRLENCVAFCNALAEVYLVLPSERQPVFTATLFNTTTTDAMLAILKAPPPQLKPQDAILFSALQMSMATLLLAMSTKRSEIDVTRVENTHQRLCKKLIPVLKHMVYNSPCLATVLVHLKYLLIIASTHKPFFLEIFDEFKDVVNEFLKPGVLGKYWSDRIPEKQLKLLKSLTPYMPGEVNCYVNILSWFVFEIPVRGMNEIDMDKIMGHTNLLDSYWRILNEPIPSTYFRFAKSKVVLFYSAMCQEGPQYSNHLIERYGSCDFLTELLGDMQVDKRAVFPLACLARNIIICMNPLHKDNIFPMDKAMELIYEEFGKDDALIQVEALHYIPGLKKAAQQKVADLFKIFADELRYAFLSDFTIQQPKPRIRKTKSFKSVRFSGSDLIDDVSELDAYTDTDKKKSHNRSKSQPDPSPGSPDKNNVEGILTCSYNTKQTTLVGYLQNKYGIDYSMYLPIYANNGLYVSNKRSVFYNCLEETARTLMEAVCSVCSGNMNKIQCRACGMKYCSAPCLEMDKEPHINYCNLKVLEKSLQEAAVN